MKMERTMTADERIRRAEEIYQRRRLNENRTTSARVSVGETPRDFKLFKKMILQIMICLCIYFIFFLVKNSNYVFSEDFIKKAQEILSYDINFQKQYQDLENLIQQNFQKEGEAQDETKNEAESDSQTDTQGENMVEEQNSNQTGGQLVENTGEEGKEQSAEENAAAAIGGAEVDTLSITSEAKDDSTVEDSSSVSQTLTDASEILQKYSLIKPLTGTITSRFGVRNPTTETVPKYHTGIDIAADTGTKFVAAMEGEVVLVSDQGDYGNHIKIQKDDVVTLYAHCNVIYVKEGDMISQGQEIGEVGATGNVTGPHLHFEVRKSERLVDPDDLLDF